jgi:glycosyltransferase involved in cell wall biosynthesis
MPRFSIVIPAYNAGATLAETLDAVLAQEYSNWECLVVDDGSTDETAAVAERRVARDSRFRLMRQDNQGTAGAYLTGVTAAVADLIVVCSADDVLLPAHLVTMDAFIRANPHHEIYSSNGFYLYEESGRHTTVYTGRKWRRERSLTFEEVVARCFYSVGVVFRRRVYESTGGHRPGTFAEDYDLWLRAMVRGARHF